MPPNPRLLHPVPVIIEVRDLSQTIFDDDAREPVRQVERSTAVTVNAQILWDFRNDPKPLEGGLEYLESGYILVKLTEIRALGLDFKFGDRITKIGDLDTELYITRSRPMAHYPPNGAALMRYYFGDRDSTHTDGVP